MSSFIAFNIDLSERWIRDPIIPKMHYSNSCVHSPLAKLGDMRDTYSICHIEVMGKSIQSASVVGGGEGCSLVEELSH